MTQGELTTVVELCDLSSVTRLLPLGHELLGDIEGCGVWLPRINVITRQEEQATHAGEAHETGEHDSHEPVQ